MPILKTKMLKDLCILQLNVVISAYLIEFLLEDGAVYDGVGKMFLDKDDLKSLSMRRYLKLQSTITFWKFRM